jgi:hypothetical protein
MEYTLIHVCVGSHVLYREVYFNPTDAKKRTRELIREKTWKLDDDNFYFGDVDVKTYTLDINVTSIA